MFKQQILDSENTKNDENNNNDIQKKNSSTFSSELTIANTNTNLNTILNSILITNININVNENENTNIFPPLPPPIILYWSETMDLALAKEIKICMFDVQIIGEKLTGKIHTIFLKL